MLKSMLKCRSVVLMCQSSVWRDRRVSTKCKLTSFEMSSGLLAVQVVCFDGQHRLLSLSYLPQKA